MAKTRERRVLKGWSYSAWASLKDCAYRFEQTYLLGLKGPTPPNMERGIRLHKIQDGYLRGEVRPLPREFSAFEDHYAQLKSMSPLTEQFWGVDAKFKAQFPDIRRGERSWCVMKMDAAILPTRHDKRLWIQDLKSGREYDNHADQGEIYACIGYAHYDCTEVDVEFWYIDQGYPTSITFKPRDIKDLTQKWIERGNDVMTPRKKYEKTPSANACRYCFLRTDQGGPCSAWKAVL